MIINDGTYMEKCLKRQVTNHEKKLCRAYEEELALITNGKSYCFLRKINMKFFLDFISCCVPVKQTVVSKSHLHIKEQESKDFKQLSFAMGDVNRKKRSNSLGSGATTQWRPSLCVISEDNVVSTVRRRSERTVRSGKQVEEKRRRTVRIQTYDDESTDKRRASVSAAIPAFSPSVFLF